MGAAQEVFSRATSRNTGTTTERITESAEWDILDSTKRGGVAGFAGAVRAVADGSGQHTFRVYVLGIRKNCYEYHNGTDFTCISIRKAERLPGEVHFHLLRNDCLKVHGLSIL